MAWLWVTGGARSGKTHTLSQSVQDWIDRWLPHAPIPNSSLANPSPTPPATTADPRFLTLDPQVLVLAATGDNRLTLAQSLDRALGYRVPLVSTTPLGFLRQEVELFWPLVIRNLGLPPLPPVFLRSETEQELATQLWQEALPELVRCGEPRPGNTPSRAVRQLLDLITLASGSGYPLEHLAHHPRALSLAPAPWWPLAQTLIHQWQQWCGGRGLLTYGLLGDYYRRGLLDDGDYGDHLQRRFRAIFADDGDEYPALMVRVFDRLRSLGVQGMVTFNPLGSVRLGFGADPGAWSQFAAQCTPQVLPPPQSLTLGLAPNLVALVQEGVLSLPLGGGGEEDNPLRVIQTPTRAQLLRRMAQVIHQAITQGEAQPQDIAIITPGTDALARYVLSEILGKRGIALTPLSEQRPLIEVPVVRGLLTLLGLVYPGLGRLIDRDQVAELLAVVGYYGYGGGLDPVRAGLLADGCFRPDPLHPCLLPLEALPRWDRLGVEGSRCYGAIVAWIQRQRPQNAAPFPHPVEILQGAIATFFSPNAQLPPDQRSALRELLETAQHYWKVAQRLQESSPPQPPEVSPLAPLMSQQVQRFMMLLRQGTLTADPYPYPASSPSITLATLFQYRQHRCHHRWQFWLDVGAPTWLTRGGGLWGASLFLSPGISPFLGAGSLAAASPALPWEGLGLETLRLQQTLVDLLGRVDDRVYLCHSDLSLGGQDQFGPLLPLIYGAQPLADIAP